MRPTSAPGHEGLRVTRCTSIDTNFYAAAPMLTTRTAARLSLRHGFLRRRAKALAWHSLSQTMKAGKSDRYTRSDLALASVTNSRGYCKVLGTTLASLQSLR